MLLRNGNERLNIFDSTVTQESKREKADSSLLVYSVQIMSLHKLSTHIQFDWYLYVIPT